MLPFLLAVPLVAAAPLQAPFHPTTPETLRAGFSSKGLGIPVLHDLCSGHSLLRSLHTDEATVYVYHDARKGFCVSLFAPGPDTEVSVSVSTPLASSSFGEEQSTRQSQPEYIEELSEVEEAQVYNWASSYHSDESADKLPRRGTGMGSSRQGDTGRAYGKTEDGEGPGEKTLRRTQLSVDSASWSGRGSMPGSLRLRSPANCVRVLAEVAGESSDLEVCLG